MYTSTIEPVGLSLILKQSYSYFRRILLYLCGSFEIKHNFKRFFLQKYYHVNKNTWNEILLTNSGNNEKRFEKWKKQCIALERMKNNRN